MGYPHYPTECGQHNDVAISYTGTTRPEIVVLCGSTRFYELFQQENYRLTMEGFIVLSVGFFAHAADRAHGQSVGITPEQKAQLDELHKRKIDLADRVFVIDPAGYIGESTRSEIDHATSLGKPIEYLSARHAAVHAAAGDPIPF